MFPVRQAESSVASLLVSDTQHGIIGRARTVLGYVMIHTCDASARSILRITITQSQAHDDNLLTDVGAVLYYILY